MVDKLMINFLPPLSPGGREPRCSAHSPPGAAGLAAERHPNPSGCWVVTAGGNPLVATPEQYPTMLLWKVCV